MSLGGLVVALLLVELGLRLSGYGSPVSAVDLVLSWDPPSPYVASGPNSYTFKPHYLGVTRYQRAADGVVLREVPVRIGADGLPAAPEPEPPEPAEVVVVGDSVSFGLGVEPEAAWPIQLGQRLQKRVKNASVPGWNTPQMGGWILQSGFQSRPEYVLWAFYLNDLMPGANLATIGAPPVSLSAPPWAGREGGFRRRSWLYNLLMRTVEHEQRLQSALSGDRSYLEDLVHHFHAPTLERHYRDMSQSCSRNNARCAVVVLPFLEGVGDDTTAKLLGEVEATAARAGLAVVRVDDCLDGMDLADRFVLPGERHPSERAHRRIAAAVQEGLHRIPGWP